MRHLSKVPAISLVAVVAALAALAVALADSIKNAIFSDRGGVGSDVPLLPQLTPRSPEVAMPEVLVLLFTTLLPILAIGLGSYLVMRLAIRREHRHRLDR